MNMRRVTHALLALTMTASAAVILTANSSTANVVGPKKVLVMRVAASDDTTTVANRWSKTDAENIFAKVDDLFQKTSYGKMSLDITVTDQFSLPSPENSYRNGNISSTAQWNKAWTDAVANAPAGLDWDGLEGVVILVKDDTASGFHRGLGTSSCNIKKGPGSTQNINQGCVLVWENKQETETAAWGRIAHEIGHAFQENATPAHPSNYNNEFELMDSNYPGHTGAFEKQAGKAFTGWLPDSQYQNVVPNVSGAAPSWAPPASAVGGGDFDLRAIEHDPATEATAQVVKAYTSSQALYYLISVHRKINGDELNPIPDEGVLIERVMEGGNTALNDCPAEPTACNRWVEVKGPGGDRNELWDGTTGKSSMFADGVSISVRKHDDDHYAITIKYDLNTRPDVMITPWRSAPQYRWETQDIWVDSPVNGYGTYRYGSLTSTYGDSVPAGNGDDPAVAQINRLYARIRNVGTQNAANVVVHIDRTDPEGRGINGANGFVNVGSTTIANIPAGGFVDTFVNYTPAFTPTPEQIAAGTFGYHTCLRVRIETVSGEAVLGNQDGDGEQENIDTFQAVADPSAPTPGSYDEVIRLRNDDSINKKQFELSYDGNLPSDWTVKVNGGDTTVELAGGEVRDIPIVLIPGTPLAVGEKVTLDVQASMRHSFVDPTQAPHDQVHDEVRPLGGVTVEARGMRPSKLECVATRTTDATGKPVVHIKGQLSGPEGKERRGQRVFIEAVRKGSESFEYLTRTGVTKTVNSRGRFSATLTNGQWLEADHVICLYAGTETVASAGFGPSEIVQ